ncbi:hypothetical protein Sjap_024060 [Stephania japonica]|uniref:MADS-box domain-containing protein n=1 Tax=Stephania japonica TaxID=461633 RepID=A0AAP0HJI8_9MAGN
MFSKRRKGLFKKSQEWSALSGNDVLVVAFSPAGRPFTPCASSSGASPDSILNRLQPMMIPSSSSADHQLPTTSNSHIQNPNFPCLGEGSIEETRFNDQEGFHKFSTLLSSVEECMNSDSFYFEMPQVLHSPELSSNYDMIYQEFSALMDTSVKLDNRLPHNAAAEEWLGWINDGF